MVYSLVIHHNVEPPFTGGSFFFTLNAMQNHVYDLAVIGGGINGTGIARDAAGRGLSVVLVEKGDIASATSSASSKLIHGGLRYLEHHAFNLVRKALVERDVLLSIAPHVIWPLNFVLPYRQGLRPWWLLRLGLYVYDALRYCTWPVRKSAFAHSHAVRLQGSVFAQNLNPHLTHGFTYADGWAQDSRLSVLNAMDAHENGAHIMTRMAVTTITREADHWTLTLSDGHTLHARALVNAAGPWAAEIAQKTSPKIPLPTLQLVRGSHIVVPKLFDHDHAFIVQNADGRIVFFIPYEGQFTLIGTTDEPQPTMDNVHTTDAEIRYLLDLANQTFTHPLSRKDVVWHYAGVRALADSHHVAASKLNRDYLLLVDAATPTALHVYGGKLTTYRKLAEDAVNKLYPHTHPWTHTRPLPGGEVANPYAYIKQKYPWLPNELAHHYARHYGTRAVAIVGNATTLDDLGMYFGGQLYAAEVDYLKRHEWAQKAEDILWRRTKHGLHLDAASKKMLEDYLT